MIPVLRVRDEEGNIRDIPAIRGGRGKSAYEAACDNGFVGTEQEWLESLKCDEKPVTSVNGVEPGENGNIDLKPLNINGKTYDGTKEVSIDIGVPSDEHIKELIDAKIVCGTVAVTDGEASPYPEGTLYVVIE